MTTQRYGDVVVQPAPATVTGMGSFSTPMLGDGWQLVARLPQSALPAGTGRYAILISGRIQNVVRSGAVPVTGVIQLCLGTSGGNISLVHQVRFGADEVLPVLEGIPFQFAMVMNASPAIVDPFFGATWDNSTGTELCIYARTHWNLDAPAYTVAFDVADISWLWWDTDNIPPADVLCERYAPASPVALSTTLSGIYLNANQPGTSAGEKWLHFGNVVYRPRGLPALGHPAPTFRFGYAPGASYSGFVTKVGTNGGWGQQRGHASGSVVGATLHQGCFWYGERPSGVLLPALMAADRFSYSAATATLVDRYTYVGIRLDNLLDVLERDAEDVAGLGCGLLNPNYNLNDIYWPLERPASSAVASPSTLVHGIAQVGGRTAFGFRLDTNTGRSLWYVNGMDQADGLRQERVSSMAFAKHGLSSAAGDLQYRLHVPGSLTAPSALAHVRDLYIVQFNFVRDPVIDGVAPAVPGNPMVLSVGRESANPATLNALPIEPDAHFEVGGSEPAAAEIRGGTGYRRTWPLFGIVRDEYPLTWSSLSESDSAALYAFLVANPAFRWTPTGRTSAIAVLQTSLPERAQVSGQVYSVRVSVAELVWTN